MPTHQNVPHELADFIENLSYLISANGHMVSFIIENRPYLLGTELLDSAVSTLQTIKFCVRKSRLGDAYTLVRKYRDDLFLYLYFIECQSRHYVLNSGYSLHEKNIARWFENSLTDLHISDIIKYIATNKTIKELITKFNLKSSWEQIGKDLNNYVHTNGVKYARQNYPTEQACDDEPKRIYDILRSITVIAIAIMILIKPQFISSTDYMDALDVGITPEKESQYHVAPFVSDFIGKYVGDFDTAIVAFLKNSVYMDI
jgi:hypothetical protein